MARGINKVILVGNLGGDPEVRYMPNGNAVTNITIAPTPLTDLQQRIITAIRSGHRRFGDMRRAALGEQPNTRTPFLRELRALEDTGQVITRRHYPGGTGFIKEYEVTP